MSDFFTNSVFFGVLLCLSAYQAGLFLRQKTKIAAFNPLLISIIIVIFVLVIFNIKFQDFYNSSKYISYLLTPATVALAIPLYSKLSLLKSNFKAIMSGLIAGVLTSLISIFVMALLFGLSHEHYASMLPKSITTAIGIGVSQEIGGIPTITTAVIIVTGVFGNVTADIIYKIFNIKNPIAKGIGLGSSAHAIGTSKALEMGETEGAMSSLSIAMAGIITVVFASFFANLI
ncbi:LrgB family protein [Lachnoanaerobaculum sp. Marseille-Q4761]|jgi:lrgB family protein|uniref:LrgB family protein n=1 Tax=Lachnoanaerobaculum sp. Marseille-Q4761 TaxID=2819511 RepID=UPI000F0EE262|nr:LrgB family protein [Lachnoanaerobaculum sp. Marseille-Q4761]MBO1871799.1 LrgB family protein [Lachnoanaerobaculum sp. Marseille-Q4761]RKW58094.1 MAG: LrgB family protein [Lachnospiraceae bacterium]